MQVSSWESHETSHWPIFPGSHVDWRVAVMAAWIPICSCSEFLSSESQQHLGIWINHKPHHLAPCPAIRMEMLTRLILSGTKSAGHQSLQGCQIDCFVFHCIFKVMTSDFFYFSQISATLLRPVLFLHNSETPTLGCWGSGRIHRPARPWWHVQLWKQRSQKKLQLHGITWYYGIHLIQNYKSLNHFI